MFPRWFCVACLGCSCLLSAVVHAQAAGQDKATADALFDSGRQLMEAGDYAAACRKFEASQAIDPGIGTLLNLADCYERSGRTASAWSMFRETLSLARRSGSRGHERVARERIDDLTPRLSYLTVLASDRTVTVTRDGVHVDPATFGTAIPVDPGSHEVVASAPGKQPFRRAVRVAGDGARVSLEVPRLADTAPPMAAMVSDASVPSPAASTRGLGAQRILALTVGALGIGALATGTVFGLQAKSALSDARRQCSPYPYCSPQGKELGKQAEHSATLSTVLFVAGGAGLAAFAALWLTAPSHSREPERVALVVSPFAVGIAGAL